MPCPTPSNPMAALVNVRLDAVSLCGEGANSRAHILLAKKKGENEMTFEELKKELKEEHVNLIEKHVTDSVANAVAANEATLKKQHEDDIAKLQGEVDTLKKSIPTPAATEEALLKNASPELRAMIEKMQSTMSGLVAAQEEGIAKARFEKVKALPVEEAELTAVLKSASPATFAILEKAAKAIEEGLIAKGKDLPNNFSDPSNGDVAYAALEKSAKAIMASSTGTTFEQAFTKACEADPETYKKYVEGVK